MKVMRERGKQIRCHQLICPAWARGGRSGTMTVMAAKSQHEATRALYYRYVPPNIPLSAIRRFARRIAEKFDPEKIILFGSFAYGTPHEWSDVDLLVVMPCYNEINQSIRIILAFDREFPLDLIVRTPKRLNYWLA